jgi:hypothetical protein
VTVLVGVMLASFFGVMNRIQMMTVSHVCVVTGLFMVAGVVVIGSRTMMFRGMLMVLSRFAVMSRTLF